MSRLEPGDVLARRYLLLDPLARGGMSVIWRAFDQSLHRMIAVKVLTASLHTDQGERVSVRSEARAAARFLHPDTIEIYDYGETVTPHGSLAAYVVMPLLDGTPLGERIEQGPLPWTDAAAIALRLARVLMAGHARGLVHRDVTAENVLLTDDGPKLLDFGIAAWAGDPEDDRGTPPYVAPERLLGAPTHPAVDVYALGVLLHTMLTGRTPYPETTWEEIEAARRTEPPPRVPGVPHAVATLCQRCLAHRPEERPTAAEIVAELTSVLGTASFGRHVRRGVTVVGSAAVALSALLWFQQTGVRQQERVISGGPVVSSVPTVSATARYLESSPASAVTVEQAVTEFQSVLEARTPCGATDADVVLDLKQVLHTTVLPRGPYGSTTENLRRKLSDRLREGRLAPACLSELQARLDDIEQALKRD
ncbi:serine/threonine protein kinase [Actinomadura sp. ATCC 31491]|uniref:non-specific serine/threonine protein kinase n=1 Tax=Actinomadura luzonensis TaxID=2805427 RepID=A0ABT0FPN5_9ACTN|nr:serine/threonine-protein kinase [Actinomadura luzonensis]MCK2213883.1 serine/threonine protein kinase [Actinomadura luzonensis]